MLRGIFKDKHHIYWAFFFKAKILEDFERLQQEALAELGKELQTKFVHEKEDIIQKYESEKNLIEQNHAEEKKQLTQRFVSGHGPSFLFLPMKIYVVLAQVNNFLENCVYTYTPPPLPPYTHTDAFHCSSALGFLRVYSLLVNNYITVFTEVLELAGLNKQG